MSSGLDCLRLVREKGPRVLILDHELPWGDGAGVLACLREDGVPLPVILKTRYASTESVQKLVVPPVISCLSNPVLLPQLLEEVELAAHMTPTEIYSRLRARSALRRRHRPL